LQSFKKSAMVSKREYEIAFVGLKHGEHEFTYNLQDEFFNEKAAEPIEDMHATVKLLLDKHKDFMMLKFQTGGTAKVNCDRCGNELQSNLWDEFNLVVKLVENPEEMNEQEVDADIFYIARSESHLEVSDWLYEFVLLSIPTQNECAVDKDGASLCNKEVLQKLEEMKNQVEEQKENSIWKGLEKFKDN
jgi:uncharacterized metal-binding protein YceD (DUF177 family)